MQIFDEAIKSHQTKAFKKSCMICVGYLLLINFNSYSKFRFISLDAENGV